jgi:hypothetical protein
VNVVNSGEEGSKGYSPRQTPGFSRVSYGLVNRNGNGGDCGDSFPSSAGKCRATVSTPFLFTTFTTSTKSPGFPAFGRGE